jgi:hypothetical protein
MISSVVAKPSSQHAGWVGAIVVQSVSRMEIWNAVMEYNITHSILVAVMRK